VSVKPFKSAKKRSADLCSSFGRAEVTSADSERPDGANCPSTALIIEPREADRDCE